MDRNAKRLIHVFIIIVFGFLQACGSGGGSSATVAPPQRFSPVARHFGDTWVLNRTTTTVGGTTTTAPTTYTVDAMNPDGSYSLAAEIVSTGAISTALMAADGNVRVTQGCISTPGEIVYDFPFYVGKTWISSFTESCNGSQTYTVTINGNIAAEENITIGAATYRTLKVVTSAVETQGNPAAVVLTDTKTCSWAVDIGVTIQCSRQITYNNTPAASALASVSYQLTSFTPGSGNVPTSLAGNVYPALTQGMPQVGALTGNSPVSLPSPNLAPVFFADTVAPYPANASIMPGFLAKLVASQQWRLLNEYGVGVASVLPAVQLASAFAGAGIATTTIGTTATYTPVTINNWLAAQLNASLAAWGSPDANSVLAIFLPANISIPITMANGSVMCQGGPLAYHNVVTLANGTKIAYAIIPDCQRGLDTITVATSHEIFEAVADPFLTGYYQTQNDFSWSVAYGGSEIGDMCTTRSDQAMFPADVGYKVARFWSNNALLGSVVSDPCVSRETIPAAPVYFNSAPDLLPGAVTLTTTNPVTNIVQTHPAAGVVLNANNTATIPVHLFSDKPTNGDWRVSAQQAGLAAGAPSTLTFSWDKTTGQNGDVLQLTITANSALPSGAAFEINSYYGGVVTHWVGAVSN